ncbi:MAG: EcsC family protein [Lachnospiraceae bacterium]|nr:EcsC family protein [Lachnospiraceae bacterium]
MVSKKSALDTEWMQFQKKEKKFLDSRVEKKDTFLNKKLEEKVPPKLQGTLDTAFAKAFGMIFEKGTGIIEKTYKKEELQKSFKINEYADEIWQTRGSLKVFEKKAESAGRLNMLVSGATGIGMGAFGAGLPDIALFVGFILRSVYEIALDYGFEYESEAERCFILMIIEGAVSYGTDLCRIDERINAYIGRNELPTGYSEKQQIERTAAGLSKELLYMKFLQGIPIVGVVGGAYDVVYLKKITEYANLKYKKRFLLKKKNEIVIH